MFILVALVVLTTQSEPIVLQGKTRFPVEAQCEAQIEVAKAALQRQVDSLGAKVADMRCIRAPEKDI